MVYDTTASLDRLTCTNSVDSGKCQDRFGQFVWSKYLDVKLKVFKNHDNNEFRLIQILTMGEADFNQFKRLRNQLVIAAENYATEENLFPFVVPTLFRDMDERLILAHKVVDVVDRANRKISVTLLRYSVDKPESSYTQVRIFARKMEEEKFQQIVYVNYKLAEFVHLLHVMKYVFDKVIRLLLFIPFIIF